MPPNASSGSGPRQSERPADQCCSQALGRARSQRFLVWLERPRSPPNDDIAPRSHEWSGETRRIPPRAMILGATPAASNGANKGLAGANRPWLPAASSGEVESSRAWPLSIFREWSAAEREALPS